MGCFRLVGCPSQQVTVMAAAIELLLENVAKQIDRPSASCPLAHAASMCKFVEVGHYRQATAKHDSIRRTSKAGATTARPMVIPEDKAWLGNECVDFAKPHVQFHELSVSFIRGTTPGSRALESANGHKSGCIKFDCAVNDLIDRRGVGVIVHGFHLLKL